MYVINVILHIICMVMDVLLFVLEDIMVINKIRLVINVLKIASFVSVMILVRNVLLDMCLSSLLSAVKIKGMSTLEH